ncbi:MAG: glycosyltransferase [bacterium]
MDLRPERLWRAARCAALRLASPRYSSWLARHERIAPDSDLAGGPLISIVTPAPEQAAASLRAQSYTRWQMGPGGEYTAFLGPGDTLSPHALAWVAAAISKSRPDAVYTDEDAIENGRAHPIFKPDWSPELLRHCNYAGGLLVISSSALDGCDPGAALNRLAERRGRVEHVPRVLYHRAGPNREVVEAVARAASLSLPRGAGDQPWESRMDAPRSASEAAPLASIIVCSRQPQLLRACLNAIAAGTQDIARETITVQHGFEEPLGDKRLSWTGAFDFAAMNNLAAREAAGRVLVFLNDDVTPLAPEWLDALAAQAMRPEVGVAGALLEYPDGAIQHAGVVVGIAGVAAHPLRGLKASPLWPWARLTREVSAVTGACLAIRKSVFEELGGFDSAFPVNYNDVDLCLRARRAGYEVILEAHARLCHDESHTRSGKTAPEERERFIERWRDAIERGDPYYSPNLSRRREMPLLSWD